MAVTELAQGIADGLEWHRCRTGWMAIIDDRRLICMNHGGGTWTSDYHGSTFHGPTRSNVAMQAIRKHH